MKSNISLEKIDAVVLCGGKGKRLGAITKNIPKPMVMIGKRPFLDILIERISSFGLKRFVLCVGYKKEAVKNYFRIHKSSDTAIVFSEEKEGRLLGTAGAIKNAEGSVKSEAFLVMNGDSFLYLDLERFLKFHNEKKAVVSIVLTKTIKRDDVGKVRLGKNDEIIAFSEKEVIRDEPYMNAGVYIFDRRVFHYIPQDTSFSIECDLFPLLVGKGIYGFVVNNDVLDIGTPERLIKAKVFFSGDHKR